MLEAAETGHAVAHAAFRRRALQLRTRLLEAQQRLASADFPVIVIVAGVEGAGASRFVNRLAQWLDPRRLETTAYLEESAEESMQPAYWRYWRRLPPRGVIGVQFGCWYTPPLLAAMQRDASADALNAQLGAIERLERALTDDGAAIVKLWFHVERKEQKKRLRRRAWQPHGVSPVLYARHGKRFRRAAEMILRRTDQPQAPWHVIDALDGHHRDLAAGTALLDAINAGLARRTGPDRRSAPVPPRAARGRSVLDGVDLEARLSEKEYARRLPKLQARLGELGWQAYRRRVSWAAVFEGWDASGKGGAIRRIAAGADARLLRVVQVAAPSDEERAHHYLWRFGRHLPRPGHGVIFDRSWYGRVLVERVDELARPAQWLRAYPEINDFEQEITACGGVLCKFWMHISPAEQLRRFRAREKLAHKRFKITPDDWHNRERRPQYVAAVDDMVARTSTAQAPWTLVPAECKRYARVMVLETLAGRLEEALERRA